MKNGRALRKIDTDDAAIIFAHLATLADLPLLAVFDDAGPFAGLVDIPFRIYFADLGGGAALQGLALQAGWTVVLVGLGRLAMERMMRRLEMQGG